jgi:hypothetical protein
MYCNILRIAVDDTLGNAGKGGGVGWGGAHFRMVKRPKFLCVNVTCEHDEPVKMTCLKVTCT